MHVSKQLFEKAKTVIPGGVNSPVRAFRSVGLDPLFIASGKGCKIQDADGSEYIDFVGSWGPLILGHAHPEVLQAINETAAKGCSFGAPTEGEIHIAEKIIEMIPSVEMVRLVNSGTEATMSAIRLARGFTKRDKIIKFEGCYQGHADSFLIKAGSGALTLGEPSSPGVPRSASQDTLVAQFNDLNSVQALFDMYPQEIAAVIIEPIAGNVGVILPAVGFLAGLRKLCDQYDSVLIFDEVMTGFRVHPGGAQALYGVTPDLTTLGKIIGGGLPVGAYGGRKKIMQMVAPSGPVYQAGTLSGNPLAVAAGLKTLEIISRSGFFDELNRKSQSFFQSTIDFIAKQNLPLALNYVNSMGCLFFKPGKVETYPEAVQSDTKSFAQFFAELLNEGVYIAPSQFEAMFISAAHNESDLNRTSEIIQAILKKMYS